MAQSTNKGSHVDRRAFVKAIGGVSALAALG